MDAAEHDLSRTLHKLNDTAQAAGYAPIWPIIVARLAAHLPVLHPEAANVLVPNPQAPPTICPPAGQRFDCVSIPATSLLLSSTETAMDVYARPGPKPTPRQDPAPSPLAQHASARSTSSDAAVRKRSRKHKRCHKCGTDRSSGSWRGSVLGIVCPTICGSCYGKEFRRLKKVSTSLDAPQQLGN
ncbi:hypothetical protein A4X09_0g6157 [Tilletia walkeri]|uniref:Uncharacterized protein n=1 Tax=Tilletia walkeri TaxID=117179 RepID=A0A8X7T2L7_9BASI|nr:hypothetical protein A4X09_0g6157 [Tilletia walkeri]